MDTRKMVRLYGSVNKVLSMLCEIEDNYENDNEDIFDDIFSNRQTWMNLCSCLNEYLDTNNFMFFGNEEVDFSDDWKTNLDELTKMIGFVEVDSKNVCNAYGDLYNEWCKNAYEDGCTLGYALTNLVACGVDELVNIILKIEKDLSL